MAGLNQAAADTTETETTGGDASSFNGGGGELMGWDMREVGATVDHNDIMNPTKSRDE